LVADEAETLVVGKLRISAKWAIRRTVRIERLTITKAPAENPSAPALSLARRLLGAQVRRADVGGAWRLSPVRIRQAREGVDLALFENDIRIVLPESSVASSAPSSGAPDK